MTENVDRVTFTVCKMLYALLFSGQPIPGHRTMYHRNCLSVMTPRDIHFTVSKMAFKEKI